MRKAIFAVPSHDGFDITKGKEYEVYSEGIHEGCFSIKDDSGWKLFCRWESCNHINGNNWTRIVREL